MLFYRVLLRANGSTARTSASRVAGCTSAAYIVACEGNLSVRLDDERILTTPTCMNKGMLTPADLVVMDLEGRQLAGDRKASSELAMHLLVLPHASGRHGDLPRTSAHRDRIRRRWTRSRSGLASGSDRRPRPDSAGEVRNARNSGAERRDRALRAALRRAAAGQSRRRHLRPGSADGLLPHGDDRALRQDHARRGEWPAIPRCFPAAKSPS